jgi:uncharacterized protein
MTNLLEERSLAERLRLRIDVEERFARTGRKFRNKLFFLKQERVLVRPLLKLALQVAGVYARGVQNALAPVVRRLTLHFADLPAAFDGFQLLHLSDFHVDGVEGLAEALVPVLTDLRPDICVMTGDYRFEDDGPCHEVYPRMESIVSSVSAKHGVFGILGNHDVSEIAFALEDMGVRMLINESVEIEKGNSSIWLAGIDDNFDYRCDDLPGALAAVPSNAFKILLAHTPELYAEASQQGVDLYLCGHTHAGQIRFPRIGSVRHNADCPKNYSYGHWSHREMHAYTSPGVGCSSLPVRYNCPPELVLIELRTQR